MSQLVRRANAGLSRRRFLKLGAAGAAAITLSQFVELTPRQAQAARARQETGTLRVVWNVSPATLDPLSAAADSEISFLNAVYDYLIDSDAQSNLVPRLASSWEVSEDGLAYTLQIVQGVKFHDGSDLTIEDIIWTFDRLKNSDGPTSDLYGSVESVEAGEGFSVVFRLSATNPDFLYALTDNHAVILKADAENIGDAFNGTGPFLLDGPIGDLEAGVTLQANPDYWQGAPGVATLQFLYLDDAEARINALREGLADVILRIDNLTFLNLTEEDFNAIDIPTNGHDLVRLRADRAPGDDVRVRRAFKMATDRQAIYDRIQLGFGALGRDTPIGPLYGAYYTEEFALPEYDPEGARALLAEAGYPDGLEMTLYVPIARDLVSLAETLAAQWAEAGINVTIEPQEEAVYYAEGGWLDVDLGITPWGSRPVPQLYLDLAYKSGAVWNEAHLSDEELDAQIEIAGTSLDQETRVAAYREIQRILIERGPVIIPYFFAQFGVFGANVAGIEVNPFAGRTRFDTAALM